MFRTLFPFTCNNEHTSHPPYVLTQYLRHADLHAELWAMQCGPRADPSVVRAPVPRLMRALLNGATQALRPRRDLALRVLEHLYLRSFRQGDAAHLFRGCSLELQHALRSRGHLVFLERINTMDPIAKRIMEDAHIRAGWPMRHTYEQAVIDYEQAQADAADFIFSPSPAVSESLRECGIPAQKILACSYGWDPGRFGPSTKRLPATEGVTILFVGSIGMRKGAHLLLRAWSKAGVVGRLVLLGSMEPTIAHRCRVELARNDVMHIPYTSDPAPAFRSADIFAFPTLEEGSALVTYEALGNGLPVITSPIGAGVVIRHRQEGLVVDAHDENGWIEALRGLAGNAALRQSMGAAARSRATQFTWDKVAGQRYQLIRQALRQGPA